MANGQCGQPLGVDIEFVSVDIETTRGRVASTILVMQMGEVGLLLGNDLLAQQRHLVIEYPTEEQDRLLAELPVEAVASKIEDRYEWIKLTAVEEGVILSLYEGGRGATRRGNSRRQTGGTITI